MEITNDLATWGVSGILSIGVSAGIVKATLANKMSFDDHRKICDKERQKTEDILDRIFDQQREQHGMIKEIHGYLKAKNGGQL